MEVESERTKWRDSGGTKWRRTNVQARSGEGEAHRSRVDGGNLRGIEGGSGGRSRDSSKYCVEGAKQIFIEVAIGKGKAET